MIVIQVIGTLIIFIITLIFGIVPLYFSRLKNSDIIISCVNSFSSGIFLAISFLDLMPEANEIYYSKMDGGRSHKYPVCYLIMIVSYSFVLILEKILFNSHSLLENHDHQVSEHSTNNKTNP